jgi:diguanylate cyclase (GGDEF)-like protein
VIRSAVLFEKAQEDSLTDPLTSLPNRRYMLQHLEQELARAGRRGLELALVLMDLDDFKEINDTRGHQVGDQALRAVAAVLRASIRPYDLCVRYGGDEFVLILLDCGTAQADGRRRALQDAVATMCFSDGPGGGPVPLAVSAGAAVYPGDGSTPEELVAAADRRMYEDKAARRTRGAVALGP